MLTALGCLQCISYLCGLVGVRNELRDDCITIGGQLVSVVKPGRRLRMLSVKCSLSFAPCKHMTLKPEKTDLLLTFQG